MKHPLPCIRNLKKKFIVKLNEFKDVIFSDWYFNGQFTQSTITRNASSVTGFNIDAVFSDWATIGTSPSSNQGADEGVFGWTVWFQEIN